MHAFATRWFSVSSRLGAILLLSSCTGGQDVDTGFSGERAFAHVKAAVEIGPRPIASAGAEKCRQWIEKSIADAGWLTSRQRFGASTPIGRREMSNVRARFGGANAGGAIWNEARKVVVGCHYDTKLYTGFEFVGANDGGSGCGVLIELASVLAAKYPTVASQVELVFFDGEEAVEENINYNSDLPLDRQDAQDGLYGSHYYARMLRLVPRENWPKAVMIVDMVGDKDLNIRIPTNCDAALTSAAIKAAREVGHGDVIGVGERALIDDHVPFRLLGIAVVNLIDFDFKPWHTKDDTLETVSAESLGATGDIVVRFLTNFLLHGSE